MRRNYRPYNGSHAQAVANMRMGMPKTDPKLAEFYLQGIAEEKARQTKKEERKA